MRKRWLLVGVVLLLVSLVVIGCGIPQEEYDELKTENTSLQEELSTLKTESTSLQEELSTLRTLYPPRDFSSLSELQEWLAQNEVSEREDVTSAERWYSKALEIQEDALTDGYIISVDYDDYDEDNASVFCVAIIDGDIWYWDPETDEPMQDYSWGKVK